MFWRLIFSLIPPEGMYLLSVYERLVVYDNKLLHVSVPFDFTLIFFLTTNIQAWEVVILVLHPALSELEL